MTSPSTLVGCKSPADKSPADKSPADKSQADKSQADKSQADKSQADKSQADKSQADKSQADTVQQSGAKNTKLTRCEQKRLLTTKTCFAHIISSHAATFYVS